MYENMEEGRAAYLLQLRAFKQWLAARVGPARSWGATDVLKSEEWKGRLDGMKEALGLTDDEDRELRQEAGLE